MFNLYNHKYNYGESIVHRMNTIIKIVSFLVFILVMLFKFNNVLFICNISLVIFYVLFSDISYSKYLNIIWKIKFIIIFIYIYLYYLNINIMKINYIVLYLISILLFLYIIVFTSTKEDISNSLGNIFNIGVYKERIKLFFYKIIAFKEIFINNINKRIDNIEYKGFDVRYRSFIVRWGLILSDIKITYKESKKELNNRIKVIKYKGYNGKDKKNKYSKKLCIFDYIILLYDLFMIIYYIMVVR